MALTADSITFARVQRGDAGTYTVFSNNTAGSGSTSFELTVQCKLPVVVDIQLHWVGVYFAHIKYTYHISLITFRGCQTIPTRGYNMRVKTKNRAGSNNFWRTLRSHACNQNAHD